MINFQKLLDWRFWFAMRPTAMSGKTIWLIAIFFGVIVAASFVFKVLAILKKSDLPLQKFFKKLHRAFLTMGLIGFVLLFFSYEQVYFLGSRFWFLLWLVGFLVWLGFAARYFLRRLPKERAEIEKKRRLEKYLPR